MHNSKIVLCAILLAIFVSSSFVLISQPLDSFGKHSVAMANASYEPMSVVANITLGKKPFCIAVNEETNRVYVGVTGGLMVISGETDQVIAEIPLGADVRVLAVNPLTNRIYAGISDNITVIDGATNLIVKTKPGGVYSSYDVAFDPVANRLYEGWSGPHMGDYDGVNVYDLEYFWFITRVDLSFTSYFENVGVAVNPKTNRVYATWTGNGSLYMIDGNTLTIIKKVNPSSFSTEMMINSYTNNVYIGNTVLNGETLEQVASNYTGDIQAIDQIHNLLYTVDYEWITLYDNATKNYYSIMNSSLYRLDGSTHGVIDSLNLKLQKSTSLSVMKIKHVWLTWVPFLNLLLRHIPRLFPRLLLPHLQRLRQSLPLPQRLLQVPLLPLHILLLHLLLLSHRLPHLQLQHRLPRQPLLPHRPQPPHPLLHQLQRRLHHLRIYPQPVLQPRLPQPPAPKDYLCQWKFSMPQ
jgi:hypothetical protein